MIAVMGATGRTGGEIVRRLLAAGERVRAIGRSVTKLETLAAVGADTRAGDASDAAFLAGAFDGVEGAFTMLPYDVTSPGYLTSQARKGEAIVHAARAARVGHVVAFSSIGAELSAGTGFIGSMHAQEERLRALNASDGTNVLVLRAAALFENFYGVLDLVRHAGMIADTVASDLPIPMIATHDVAAEGARALLARNWRGFEVRELLGQRDLSYAEATRIIGERIGVPGLPYVRVADADVIAGLTAEGWSADMAALHIELNAAISEGRVRSLEGRTSANSTLTSFEAFAEELAQAYHATQEVGAA